MNVFFPSIFGNITRESWQSMEISVKEPIGGTSIISVTICSWVGSGGSVVGWAKVCGDAWPCRGVGT